MKFIPFLGVLILITNVSFAQTKETPKMTKLADNSANYYADLFSGKNFCEKRKESKEDGFDNQFEKKFIINASAYTAAADECGKSDGITASGNKVRENHTLACPPQYKFGTKIYIEGMGTYVCEDRGGAIKGNHFDIYMQTKQEAFRFGRRNLQAYVAN